jgi:hypothetical protein
LEAGQSWHKVFSTTRSHSFTVVLLLNLTGKLDTVARYCVGRLAGKRLGIIDCGIYLRKLAKWCVFALLISTLTAHYHFAIW